MDRLAKAQKELADLLKSKETLTNADIEHANRLRSDIAESEAMLGLKSGFDPKIAAAQDAKGGIGKSSGDSLTKVGNFLGSARGQIETLAAEHVKIAREHLAVARQTEKNTRPRTKPIGENHYPIN